MEIRYCPRCISMTIHNETNNQCLNCNTIASFHVNDKLNDKKKYIVGKDIELLLKLKRGTD